MFPLYSMELFSAHKRRLNRGAWKKLLKEALEQRI
jgi:hypothetical protein